MYLLSANLRIHQAAAPRLQVMRSTLARSCTDSSWLVGAAITLNFEWDEEKAKANLKNHRVSFDEATTVFCDPFSIRIPDPDHSAGERRYVDIGSWDRG